MRLFSFLILGITFSIPPAYSDDKGGILPIRVKIIQCGKMQDMGRTCEKNPACCVFYDPELDESDELELAEASGCANPANGIAYGSQTECLDSIE